LALILATNTRLRSLVGDSAISEEQPEQVVAIASEQGFPYWCAWGMILRGWVKVKNGDVTEGISLLRCGTTAYRATGAELSVPTHLAFLARACEIAGQVEEAVTLLDDALQIGQRTGEGRRNPEARKSFVDPAPRFESFSPYPRVVGGCPGSIPFAL
jgi:adenylate cyclase